MSIPESHSKYGNGAHTSDGSGSEFFHVIYRRKWSILFFFVIVAGGITLYALTSPKMYDSEAKVMIKVGRESVALDPTVTGRTVNVVQNRSQEVNSELFILRSRDLMAQVVERLGPSAILGSASQLQVASASTSQGQALKDRAVNAMIRNFKAEVARDSNVIVMNMLTREPAVSNQALNLLLDLYLERHIAIHKTQAKPQFFQDKVAALEKELANREEALKTFRSRYGISAMEKQKEVTLNEIGRIRTDLVEAETMAKVSGNKIAYLEQILKTRPKERELSRLERTVPRDFIENLKKDLMKLRIEESDLTDRYMEDEPDLLNVRTQIKVMEATLAEEGDSFQQMERSFGQDTVYRDFELALQTERKDLMAEQARQAALKAELGKHQAELDALINRETELLRLERQVEIAEKEYLEYRANLQQAQISDALDNEKVSNVSIIHRPTLSSDPVGMQLWRKILLGVFLGAFGALGLAFFRESLERTVRNGRTAVVQPRRMGLPTLITLTPEEMKNCI